jgi:hypothetical protein
MKKLAYTLLITAATFLTACSGSTSKTGGDVADSGMSGSSGAADTGMAAGSGSPVGTSTGGTDTSTTASKDGVASPVTDTPMQKQP